MIFRLEPDDPTCIQRNELFQGELDNIKGNEDFLNKEKSNKVFYIFNKFSSIFLIIFFKFLMNLFE